mgnify:CR=1 FL=1
MDLLQLTKQTRSQTDNISESKINKNVKTN